MSRRILRIAGLALMLMPPVANSAAAVVLNVDGISSTAIVTMSAGGTYSVNFTGGAYAGYSPPSVEIGCAVAGCGRSGAFASAQGTIDGHWAGREGSVLILDSISGPSGIGGAPVTPPPVVDPTFTSGGQTLFLGGGSFDAVSWTTVAVQVDPPPVAAAVPEPSTWALMIAGLLGLGLTARRGRKPVAIG